MSMALVDLVGRLRVAIPARNDVPADYAELVKAAVWQLSSDVPVVRQTEVYVTPGVDSYALPSDCLSMIALVALPQVGQTVLGGTYLMVAPDNYHEQVWVEGDQLRISPTPTYTATRTLRYAAAHILDGNSSYPRLSANGARIALLYAQYLTLQEQASATAGDGWMYRIGDETVDKRGQGAAIQTQALAVLMQYQNAVKALKGYGSVARYGGDPDVV